MASRDELERESNELLEKHGFINYRQRMRNSGDFYTEKQLKDHHRLEMTNYEDGLALMEVAHVEIGEMVFSEVLALAERSRFTLLESTVWGLCFVEELPEEDVAVRLDMSPGAVGYAKRRCRNKMAATAILSPFCGWWEVYWSEVNRR